MNQALLDGVSMGLLLSAMIGPVFFALIQNSMENGFRYAAVLASGILVSDLFYVLITYFSVSLLAKNPYFEIILGYLGGAVLVGFGIVSFFKKNKDRPNTGGLPVIKSKKRTAFLKGFGINGINPFVMLFWISIAGLVNLKTGLKKIDVVWYYSGILFTVFMIDLLKAYIAKQLSRWVTPQLMVNLNRLVALVFVFFGGKLFWFAIEKQMML